MQHGKRLNMTMEELLGMIGIMMLTGYRPVHNKRYLWCNDDDVSSLWVKELMARNRFLELLKYLHLADNKTIDSTDRYYKVRPFFQHLNAGFKFATLRKNLSVDEGMALYYGRHGTKQYIRGKPLRYGYKIWCLAASSGYLEQIVGARDMVKVYKSRNFELVPPSLLDMFVARSAVFKRATRASDAGDLHMSRCHLEQTKRSFRHRAAVTWNGLPKRVTERASLAAFNRAVPEILQ